MDLLNEINRMQDYCSHLHIEKIEDNWAVFYEEDEDTAKGFVFLYIYKRLPYNPEYNTGTVAEIGDCNSNSYPILKELGFIDSKDNRVWLHCSG